MQKNYLASLLFACLLSGSVMADDTTSATMSVSLEVQKSCTFAAGAMDMGSAKSSTSADVTSSAQLNVTCTRGTPFTITTANQTLSLQSSTGGSPVNFALYSNSNATNQLTPSTGLAGTGTGQAQSIAVYGKVAASDIALASAGKYSADITLNMTY